MSAKAAFRQSDVRRAIQAVESGGSFVRAVEIEANGTIRVLTGERPLRLASNNDDDWVASAGETEVPRAKGS